MSQIMWLVISIVVILIVALVILTIFGRSIFGVSTITEARSYCSTLRATTCSATGSLPREWNIPTIKVGNQLMSCGELVPSTRCENEQFTS